MNEIKFLAWNSIVNRMGGPYTLEEFHKTTVGNFFNLTFFPWSGLFDVDGREICRGHIFESESHGPKYLLVDFIEGGFCALYSKETDYPIDINHFYPSVGCDIKIVGHIMENPELIPFGFAE